MTGLVRCNTYDDAAVKAAVDRLFSLIGGVEDVRAVLMYVDIFLLFGIDITCNIRSFINNKALFTLFCEFTCM